MLEKKLIAVTNSDEVVVGVAEASATSQSYFTEEEWLWLWKKYNHLVPVRETRRMSKRPRRILPCPTTCTWCKSYSRESKQCTLGRSVPDETRTTCYEWKGRQ